MPGSVNEVTLIGNLGDDPDRRNTPSGAAVTELRLATNESWTDKNGQKQERVEWHRVVVWGKLAELCGEYLSKGRQVYVRGALRTRKWEDKDGATRYTTEIVVNSFDGKVVFLGSKGGSGESRQPSSRRDYSDDDVSF